MIRHATANDMGRLLEIGHLMIAESAFSTFNLDEKKLENHIAALISHGFALVHESDGSIRGVMLGDIVSPWFSSDRMGIEYVIYLQPEYRSGLVAARMINKWVNWCIDGGAVQIRPGVSTGNESVSRLYERLGFVKTGATFALDVTR